MELEILQHASVPIIRIRGEIGGAGDPELIEAAAEQLAAKGVLVIDLSGVSYLNSTGINTLVRINAQANVQEQRVMFAAPTHMVSGVFRTTRLDKFFEVRGAVDDAVAQLQL